MAGRACDAVVGVFRTYPWIGWAGWTIFVVAVLARMHPRRFGAAFQYYLDFAEKLWTGQTVYDPNVLGDVAYGPSSLLLFVPLTPPMDPTVAGLIALTVFAVLFSLAAVALMRALLDGRTEATMLAGVMLLINIPAGWYHFKQVQLHIPMTAAMMLAAAAMIHLRWHRAALWLVTAVLLKLTAIPMLMLAGALVARTRLLIAVGLIAGFALPFSVLSFDHTVEQYRLFALKLLSVATAPPADWPYQADFTTLLRGAGLVLPGPLSLAIRLAAALGALWLAWRVRRACGAKAFALALLLLSACFITLFGPRNENVSYLVLTPALSVLALLLLLRNSADLRGWLLVAACVALGFVVSPSVDAITKPAIMTVLWVWVAWLMAVPERWAALVEAPVPELSLKS